MSYIDSSSLLKTLWEESESRAVREIIAGERQVIVSSLTELETEVQLRAKWLSGAVTRTRYHNFKDKLATFKELSPFEFRDLPGEIFREAIRQHNTAKQHCGSLDRLHIAAMHELKQRRLITNDLRQAAVAKALGYDVISPA